MILLFAYLALALIVSFMCSIMESVLLSISMSFLLVKKENGHKWTSSFIEMKNNINKPLSAILSLNTVAHTIGAAGVGAQAVKVFGDASFGIVSVILTILILVVTEIIPKTIGAKYSKGLAHSSFVIINAMIFITYPLVVMAEILTKLFSKKEHEKTVSREEIAVLANIGTVEGVFSEKEHKIIQNILKLKNIKVNEIMTPKIVVAIADENLPLEDFLKKKDYLNFSRIPIFHESENNITGYVFRQTVFEKLAENQPNLKLKDIKRKISATSTETKLLSLWESLLESKEHIAIVMNQYGGFDGVVTMEDIIESLLGLEIVDENDTITNMRAYAEERWKTRQSKYNLLNNE